MSNTIDECPICGGNIQTSRTEYTKHAVLDADGGLIDDGVDAGVGSETTVYCQNDHSQAEMMDAVEQGKAAQKPRDVTLLVREVLTQRITIHLDAGEDLDDISPDDQRITDQMCDANVIEVTERDFEEE